MANKLAQDIENCLKPLTGGLIAKVTVKSQCSAIGTTPDALSQNHLNAFCSRLELALKGLGKSPGDIQNIIQQVRKLT
jgi:hypothetical protein